MSGVYYNENDPFAAAWLRNLIFFGEIAGGDVDERSIEDVTADDLRNYDQHHFFAGIGIWSYALRRAGWPGDRPVWTGSCPCQPFSAAGKGGGFADERHLWPAWHWLIDQYCPDVVLGEQVASKDGLRWFDLVSADLEGSSYAVGASDQCVAGFGGPHIRQRLWYVGLQQSQDDGWLQRWAESERWGAASGCGLGGLDDDTRRHGNANEALRAGRPPLELPSTIGGLRLADSTGSEQGWLASQTLGHGDSFDPTSGLGGLSNGQRVGRQRWPDDGDQGRRERASGPHGAAGGLWLADGEQQSTPRGFQAGPGAEPSGAGAAVERLPHHHHQGPQIGSVEADQPRVVRFQGSTLGEDEPLRGHWRGADWLWFRDGKYRPVEPGTFPLAHGAPNRVGRLRGYGNAINAEVAQGFIEAVMAAL